MMRKVKPKISYYKRRCWACDRQRVKAMKMTFAHLKATCPTCYWEKRNWLYYFRRPHTWRERLLREQARRAASVPLEQKLVQAAEERKLWD